MSDTGRGRHDGYQRVKTRPGAAIVTALTLLVLLALPVTNAEATPSGPVGAADAISETEFGWAVYGWMWDPTGGSPLVVAIVNGEQHGLTSPFFPRPDVPAVHPGAPANTGYILQLDGLGGDATGLVCLFAASDTAEPRALLGCLDLPPPTFTGSPSGALDEVTPAVGRVTVSGWAVDPNPDTTPDYVPPALVHVYVDGKYFDRLHVDKPRADVQALVPHAGPNDGYWAVLPARAGPHQVCVYAINRGGTGRNVTLGCRDVVVPDSSGSHLPFGYLDGVYIDSVYGSASATFGVTGWAAAPNQGDVDVRVLAVGGVTGFGDGNWDVTGHPDEPRPDVVDAFPGTRPDTGYHIVAGGGHVFEYTLVCAVARAAADGSEALLGCYAVTRYDGTTF